MAGRNKKYTTDMLKMIVRQFRQEDTENKITVSRLINYSRIPKDVWYRNKEILDYIKQANFAPLLISVCWLKENELKTIDFTVFSAQRWYNKVHGFNRS